MKFEFISKFIFYLQATGGLHPHSVSLLGLGSFLYQPLCILLDEHQGKNKWFIPKTWWKPNPRIEINEHGQMNNQTHIYRADETPVWVYELVSVSWISAHKRQLSYGLSSQRPRRTKFHQWIIKEEKLYKSLTR